METEWSAPSPKLLALVGRVKGSQGALAVSGPTIAPLQRQNPTSSKGAPATARAASRSAPQKGPSHDGSPRRERPRRAHHGL